MFKCVNPKLINLVEVPCGNCYNCQMRKRAEWDFRLLVESLYSIDSLFLTLTYDNEHLEDLNKRTLQLWFKSLRNDGLKFTYYAVGEYGERSGRQHYHILLFVKDYGNKKYFCKESLLSSWNNGIIDVGDVTPSSIHYVTKWHVSPKYPKQKKLSCTDLLCSPRNLEPHIFKGFLKKIYRLLFYLMDIPIQFHDIIAKKWDLK